MAAKKISRVGLGDLVKQVPKNQITQFNKFRDISIEYQRRVNSLPETLPKIDWNYYQKNVRSESVKIIEDFQRQYEEVKKIFDSRYKTLDLSKYFAEVEQQKAEVQKEVTTFKKASDERIAQYMKEIERVKKRIPYGIMTMEEFCLLVPEKSPYCPCAGRQTFWPFDEMEQRVGPPEIPSDHHGEEGGEGQKTDKKDTALQAKAEEKSEAKKQPEKSEPKSAPKSTGAKPKDKPK